MVETLEWPRKSCYLPIMSLTTVRSTSAGAIRRLHADARAEIADDLSALRPGTGSRRFSWDRADLILALVLLAVAWVVYAAFALRLAHGQYDSKDNFGFDFDPDRNLKTFVGWPPDRQGFKHPFFVLLRATVWPFEAIGLNGHQAAGLAMASFGAGTVALVFAYLRACRVGRPEASALTVLYAVSCTPIFTSMIVDAYGPAAFTIVLTWLVARLRLDDPGRWRLGRYGVALAVFGITLTNVVQVAIAEALVLWRHFGIRAAIGRLIGFGLIAAALALVLALVIWPDGLLGALHNPVYAAKELYWLQTKGERKGLGQLLVTFFGFSFVAPHFGIFRLPEGIDMVDFRTLSFGLVGWIALLGWLGFWAVGAVAAFRHPVYRPLAVAIAGALAFNLMLHMHYQFRGSLFIYAGHLHFLVFALGAGLAPWLADARPPRRWAYVACVLALAVCTGVNNFPRAASFVTRFDNPTVHEGPCEAPCVNLGAAPSG